MYWMPKSFTISYSSNPNIIIGIYQNIWDKYRNVIGIWTRRILNGESICIFGDGTQKRAFSDIKFYMQPFEKLMTEFDGEVFNIGADHEYELNTVAEIIQKVGSELGYNSKIEHFEKRHEVKDAYCNHDKAKKMLNFSDDTNIEATIREMFIWAKNQPAREVKKMDYEIEKDIYSFWK